MKFKVFCVQEIQFLEQQVNNWLKHDPSIKIEHTQLSIGNNIILSIFYKGRPEITKNAIAEFEEDE